MGDDKEGTTKPDARRVDGNDVERKRRRVMLIRTEVRQEQRNLCDIYFSSMVHHSRVGCVMIA